MTKHVEKIAAPILVVFVDAALGVKTDNASQVRSGQVRPAHQRRPRFRAQAQKVRICTQLPLTCGKNRKTSQGVSSIRCCPKPHLSNIQDPHTGNTHSVLIFFFFPRVSWTAHTSSTKRMPGMQTLNPPMRKQTGINSATSRNTHLDLQHHCQAASTVFHAKKCILWEKGVSVLHRLR